MLTRLFAYLRGILGRRRAHREADDELAFHIEQETAVNVARGMSPAEARRQALAELGGLTQTTESVRDVRTTWLDAVRQDSGYAWRRFARERGLFAAAVLTFALGIGGTTATYSVVYGVLLRPLPVADEDSVVVAYETDAITDTGYYSYPAFQAWRQSGAFADLAATSPLQLDLTGDPSAERITATSVSGNFFQLLGVHTAIGRVFTAVDLDAAEIPAVISDTLWRRRYGADPSIVGKSLTTANLSAVIVGVMPPGFERWREQADAWLPIERTRDPQVLSSPGYLLVRPIGRLAPGASLSDTNTVLDAIPDPRSSTREAGVRLVRLRDDVVPPRIERLLVIVFTAVLLTWVVVCANSSMLLLERGARRGRELAVRLALGASRARMCAQLLIESTWLAFVGGAIGVGLAIWAVRLFIASGPPELFDTNTIHVDGPMLAFAAILTAATALFSGVLPALRSSRPRAALITRDSNGAPTTHLSHLLIVSQIAVALVVLAGASLLVKSLVRMQQVDLGFDGERVLTARVNLPASRYGGTAADNTRHVQAQRELIERMVAIPGVEDATVGNPIFIPGIDSRVSIAFDDGRRFLNAEPSHYEFAPGARNIGPGYMRIHGIRVVAGREFDASDIASAQHVVLINETMARLHWSDEDPLGRRVNFGQRRGIAFDFNEPWATVIGVVADVRHGGVDLPVKPEVYRAQFQRQGSTFNLILRAAVPPETLMASVRDVVHAFDPEIPLFDMHTIAGSIAETTATARYSSTLLSGLAGMTVVLCAVGIFSLLASAVAARRREIAIRLALGAVPRRMVGNVIVRVAVLLAIGASIGVTAALLGAHTLSGLLYDVAPLDPVAHAIGIVVLAVVGIAAAWIPARRAAAIDPVIALREE